MLKPELTFDRFLATFVPGAVFVFGSFYLHRPMLLKYFPYLAGYATGQQGDALSPESRILLFSIAAICMGVIFDQLSDAAVVSVLAGEEDVKPRQRSRKIVRWLSRPFVWRPLSDTRRFVFMRYLDSPRRQEFLRMVEHWGFSGESEIQESGKVAIVHQHIIMRLRTLSGHYQELYREMHAPLSSAAALYSALIALFAVALSAFFSSFYMSSYVRVHTLGVYLGMIAFIYVASVITAFNLKRRVRNFYSQIITLALHSFAREEQAERAEGAHNQRLQRPAKAAR